MSPRSWLAVCATAALVLGCRTVRVREPASHSLLATDRERARVAAEGWGVDSVLAYWADDARVVLPDRPAADGKGAIRAMIADMTGAPGFHVAWTPDSAAVSRSGDLGYSWGTNAFTVADAAGRPVTTRGRYLTVWRRAGDGRWRCVQEYSTPEPATPEPATPLASR